MRTKESSSTKLKFNGSEWICEKTTLTHGFDSLMRRWNVTDTKTEKIPLSEYNNGLFKKISLKIIERRVGMSDYSLEAKTALFVRTLTVSIPRTKRFKHIFLSLVKGAPKAGSGVVVLQHDLSRMFTTQLSFRVLFSETSPFNFKLSKAKRISLKSSIELRKNFEAYPNVLQRFGKFYRILL